MKILTCVHTTKDQVYLKSGASYYLTKNTKLGDTNTGESKTTIDSLHS